MYIDQDWSKSAVPGDWLLIEAYSALDPVQSPKFWDNRTFKQYVVAVFKKQWAAPLKKFSNISLPGGVTINGQDLYDEAIQEIKEIEDDIIGNGAPLSFVMG
jgi:hypothetical protein